MREVIYRKMNTGNYKYDYEINSWIRTLDYLQQESIFIKNDIAEAIKHSGNKELLEKLEIYQNTILNKETVISFLRMDIHNLKKDLLNGLGVTRKYNSLRMDMIKMENEFILLRSEFNTYLQEIT